MHIKLYMMPYNKGGIPMKKIVSLLIVVFLTLNIAPVFAATLDPNIPIPYNVSLTEEGDVSWKINKAAGVTIKKFQIRLIKRSVVSSTSTTGIDYKWTEYGSIKSIDGEETSAEISIGSEGVYRVRVRAVNVDNNYSAWGESQIDIAVTKDSANTIIISGGQNWSSYNQPNLVPGSTNQGTNLYIGADGSLQYSSIANSNQNVGPNVNVGGLNIYNKSAFAQGIQQLNPNTTQVNQVGPGTNNNYNQNNYYGIGPSGGQISAANSQEMGWHVDNRGRYYNAGNGNYLANMWALIDGKYYRFDANGYAYVYAWFKDPQNNSWYYLGANGEMYTGWQFISGIWYYLNPQRGTNYGVMYSNTVAQINGKYYAFNQDGSMISNAWFNGKYYGADGSQI